MPSRVLALADDVRVRIGALVVVGLWALFQCLWNLGGPNVTGDEDIYVRAGWQYVHGDFTGNREHPPTAKYLFGLAQFVAGQGPTGPRVLVGLLTLAVGVVLFVWLRREVGWWGGLLAAALWWLTPRGGAGPRVDRLALLDPVMTAFAVFAIVAAWWWIRSERAWWAAPVSGVLMAVSVTSKVSTVVLLPAFLLLPFLFRAVRKGLVGGALWAAAFAITFVALYVPMGIRSAITYMVTFQEGQNTNGHPITIDGKIYTFAPWWASLQFMANGTGKVLLLVIVVGVLAALIVRFDRLVAYIGVAFLLIAGFYVVVAKIALPTYYTAWMPFLLVLAAIGLARLATVPPRWLTVPVVLVLVVALVVPSVRLSQAVVRAHPTGIALLPVPRPRGRAGRADPLRRRDADALPPVRRGPRLEPPRPRAVRRDRGRQRPAVARARRRDAAPPRGPLGLHDDVARRAPGVRAEGRPRAGVRRVALRRLRRGRADRTCVRRADGRRRAPRPARPGDGLEARGGAATSLQSVPPHQPSDRRCPLVGDHPRDTGTRYGSAMTVSPTAVPPQRTDRRALVSWALWDWGPRRSTRS